MPCFSHGIFCKKNLREKSRRFLFSRKSVDFNGNLLVYANSARTHYGTNRLGNSALLADYSAHILGANVQMINHNVLLVRSVNGYLNSALVFNKCSRDCDKKFF